MTSRCRDEREWDPSRLGDRDRSMGDISQQLVTELRTPRWLLWCTRSGAVPVEQLNPLGPQRCSVVMRPTDEQPGCTQPLQLPGDPTPGCNRFQEPGWGWGEQVGMEG